MTVCVAVLTVALSACSRREEPEASRTATDAGPFQPAESGIWQHDEPVAEDERGYYRVKVELP